MEEIAIFCAQLNCDLFAGQARHFFRTAVRQHVDAFAGQDLLHFSGDISILAHHQPRAGLDKRDLAAKAAKRLGDLDPDIAAAKDHKVRR